MRIFLFLLTGAKSQKVFEFLYYCRTGSKRRQIYPIFGYKNIVTFNRHLNQTIDLISNSFVKKYLGVGAFTIESIEKNHTPNICTEIFPTARGIIDGGYYKVQKLLNHVIQKKTYSNHKHYNLIKFLDLTLMDGTIFDCYGPFFADDDHNDPSIFDYIVKNNENNIKSVFDTSLISTFSLLFPL